MYGEPAPPGDLLPWDWARDRLERARDYWIGTVRPNGRPHSRPVWAVWLPDGLWFSTGSLARHNLATNPEITVNLGDADEVVIVEGTALHVPDDEALRPMCEVYSAKYKYPISPIDGQVVDSSGTGGPAYLVRPRVIFGWDRRHTSPTRWRFDA